MRWTFFAKKCKYSQGMFLNVLRVFVVLVGYSSMVATNETRVDYDAQGPMQVGIDRKKKEPFREYIDVFVFGPRRDGSNTVAFQLRHEV